MTKAPQPSEALLQRTIVEFLRLALPQCVTFAVPNAAIRSATGRPGNAVFGLLSGIPDLVIVAPEGRTHFIEVKTGKGKLSPAQQDLGQRFLKMSVPYAVCRSLADVRAAIEHWRLSSREAA